VPHARHVPCCPFFMPRARRYLRVETIMRMLLVLEDGKAFAGDSFGFDTEICGWVRSEYSIVGYQEILTDPDNRGCILNMTYPHIGNYGVNPEDQESSDIHAAALVVREKSRMFSNWRAKGSLEDFMAERKIVGMEGVDTRTLALHLRDLGEMRGIVGPESASAGKLLKKLKQFRSPRAADLIRETAEQGRLAATFSGNGGVRIAVLDLGIRRSLVEQLRQCGCDLAGVGADASWADIEAMKPEGLFVSNGPGDPRELTALAAELRKALGKLPVFGVSLGCQLLALAAGAAVVPMKAGHHGANYPVRDEHSGRTLITCQNHRFVVEAESLKGHGLRPWYVNLTDRSVEGIVSEDEAACGVQFSPMADDEGRPNDHLRRFAESAKNRGARPRR